MNILDKFLTECDNLGYTKHYTKNQISIFQDSNKPFNPSIMIVHPRDYSIKLFHLPNWTPSYIVPESVSKMRIKLEGKFSKEVSYYI